MNADWAAVLNYLVSYVNGCNSSSCCEPCCHLLSLVCPTFTSIVNGYYKGHRCALTAGLCTSCLSFALGNQKSFQRRATTFHLTSSAPFFPTYTPHYTHHKHTHTTHKQFLYTAAFEALRYSCVLQHHRAAAQIVWEPITSFPAQKPVDLHTLSFMEMDCRLSCHSENNS